jgi:uncharacterized coiled-coil DUF342 family protein
MMAATNFNEKLKNVDGNNSASIDQIREILFGQEIDLITERISELKASLDKLNVKLADLADRFEMDEKEKKGGLQSLRNEDKRIQKAIDDINQKIGELLANKVDRQQMSQALKVLADDLDNS